MLYGERNVLDVALEHRRHSLRLLRQGGPHRGENRKEFDNRLKAEEDAVQKLEQLVQDHKNDYLIRSRSMSGDPMGRALLALSLGLPLVAVDDVLLQSSVQSFGGEGARLQLELLLQLGRADLVRGMLDDPEMRESKHKLDVSRVPAPAQPGYLPFYRMPAYEWLRFLQAAATGDYAQAAETLDDLVQPLADSSHAALRQLRPAFPMVLAFELGLAAEPQLLLPRLVVLTERSDVMQLLNDLSFQSAQRADLYVLAGLLAVERGSRTAALQSFDAALTAAAERTPQADFAAAPLAADYRSRLQDYGAPGEEK
jgi:hypothetical protein